MTDAVAQEGAPPDERMSGPSRSSGRPSRHADLDDEDDLGYEGEGVVGDDEELV
jgi:hypothetical protein